jgi:hypothetical protein
LRQGRRDAEEHERKAKDFRHAHKRCNRQATGKLLILNQIVGELE